MENGKKDEVREIALQWVDKNKICCEHILERRFSEVEMMLKASITHLVFMDALEAVFPLNGEDKRWFGLVNIFDIETYCRANYNNKLVKMVQGFEHSKREDKDIVCFAFAILIKIINDSEKADPVIN